MRILIVFEGEVPSSYRHSRADILACGFIRLGHEVTVLCARPPISLSENIRKEEYKKIKLIYLPAGYRKNLIHRGLQFFHLFWKLKEILNSQKFDLLRSICLLSDYATVLANKKYGYPIIASLTDFYSDFYKQLGLPLPQVALPVITYMERRVIKRSDLVIVDTPVMRETWERWGLDEKRSVVLPHGIDEEFASGKKEKIQKKYNLGNERIVFFHGDIAPPDGVDILVEAIKIVSRTNTSFKTMIVGEGAPGYMNFLRKMIKDKKLNEHFIFTGWVPHTEVPDYLSCADVCVHPCRLNLTTGSNVPNKVLEYIGANKPVIASEMPGLKMMFPDAFFYVPPESPTALAEGIIKILTDEKLREKLVDKTKEMANYYLWDKIVLQEERILKALVSKEIDNFQKFDWQLTYRA